MEEDDLTASARCGTNGSASLPFDRAAAEGLDAETCEGHDMDRRKHRLARAIGWRDAEPLPDEPPPPRLGME